MADQLTEAANLIERMLVDSYGAGHSATRQWDDIKRAIDDARRYRADSSWQKEFVVNVTPLSERKPDDVVCFDDGPAVEYVSDKMDWDFEGEAGPKEGA